MAESSSIPGTVDIKGYAGDTLTRSVTAPAALVDGLEWTAQIKAARDSDVVDAEFTITPPAVAGGPAYLVLPAAETARLVEGAAVRRVRTAAGQTAYEAVYEGVWDCQVSGVDGADPVTTLVQGKVTITLDVSRG